MEKKYKFGLSKKMLTAIILLSTFICIVSCLVGYTKYKDTISKLYNENGYVIGDIILDEIDANNITKYVQTWESDENYAQMKEFIEEVLAASNAKYIYIAVPETSGKIKYVYDSSGMEIGQEDQVTKYLDEALQIYNTGEEIRDNYFVRKSQKYGYLTSSIIPIVDENNNTSALLFVDIAMEVIESTLWSYIIFSIFISLILTLIFCIICYVYMNRTVISPLHKIETCMNEFADNDAKITEQLNDIKTKDELQDLSQTIYAMEHEVVSYINQVTSITAEKERIGAELNVAKQIQANMLPSVFPPFPDRKEFDIYATMNPAKEVGGDFYDFFMIDDNHVGITMADVSGKGVPAALFMMISKILIKNRAQMSLDSLSPASILAHVNNQLCENNKAEMFVTVWFGIFDINTGVIVAANAGHEYPAIKHNGKYELLKDKHGFVLAGMENLKFKDYEIKLEKGDSLFVYTDGVAEATNSSDELFGTDRMLEALNLDLDAGCEKTLSNVQSAIDGFVLEAPQFDDITMLCLEYFGA